MAEKPFVHPYIPNSVPETKQAMLDELGLSSVEEIYAEIPDRLRFKGTLDIPPAILSERQLRKHVQGLLDKNTSSVDFMNFCGAGCWQHHVPSVVDEIINRAEFVSAYCGGDYSRPRQVPHALRVQQHDGRTARLRRRRQPHLRLG